MASARMNESSCPTVILHQSNSTPRLVNMNEARRAPISIIQTLQFSQSIHHIDFFFIYVKLLMTCHDKLCVHWWMRGATVIMKFLFLFISVCMYLHKCWFEAKCLWWVKTKKMQTDNLQTKKKKLTVESSRAVTSLPALLLPLAHVSHRLHI